VDLTQLKPEDRAKLGEKIRGVRMLRGFSQAHLAAAAGVGITTIYKAEQGKTVRREFLRRIIRDGLGSSPEEFLTSQRVHNAKPADAVWVKHHGDRTVWFVYGDRRRLVPEGNLNLIQDVHERIRLGQLGLAYLFGCGLDYLMPDGPGMLIYEVHGPTEPVSQNYRDAIYYVLRGSVRITIAGETVQLDEGESIGCDGTKTVTMDLSKPLQPGQLPPHVQFIGANRVGKMPKPRK
jgi:transcriptional regulator with XRE-family HTH domain